MPGSILDEDPDATMVASMGELDDELKKRRKRDRASVVVLAGTNVGEMYRLDGVEVVVGRASNANIRLNDDGISRRHARIFLEAGKYLIEDLGSANGTLVNGLRIAMKQVLEDGDKIRLGPTTILKFGYSDDIEESFQQRMYDAALRDGLTGAYNKKFFLDRLDSELSYSRRHQFDLSLLMFDVDYFKRINDTYGHLAGDAVLVKLAKLAAGALRQEDVFGRYGGEEFAILCRGVKLHHAGVLGERLRSTVESSIFEHDGRRYPVTISVGVASYPTSPVETPFQLIAAADEALYEAKRCGRNRVLLKQS
ncbi:MAG: GGDEF domain-containing protein [Myxococcales bacterium]|jgi:diguanylate cyclase (GGDEF)-like protein|nr:GGDEF domain-containing protein [Myxococcales bacterium]